MTLENILEQFASNIVLSPNKVQDAKQQATLDLKQYAREMCDKQKVECAKVGYAMDAPYPIELQ